MMAARFQRDVSRCPPSALACGQQRRHFSMRLPCTQMRALAYDFIALHDHATHSRVRPRRPQALFSQAQSLRHKSMISGSKGASGKLLHRTRLS